MLFTYIAIYVCRGEGGQEWLNNVDYVGLPPTTVQSPALGYFSDAQFKLCYAASPNADYDWQNWDGSFSLENVNDFVVGRPVADTIENVTLDENVNVKSCSIFNVLRF